MLDKLNGDTVMVSCISLFYSIFRLFNFTDLCIKEPPKLYSLSGTVYSLKFVNVLQIVFVAG